MRPDSDGLQEVVGDKGYHSNQALVDLEAIGVRSYISEPDRGRRNWKKKPEARCIAIGDAFVAHAACARYGCVGSAWSGPFAHLYETGGMRRVYLRGHTNILKRLLITRAVSISGCSCGS